LLIINLMEKVRLISTLAFAAALTYKAYTKMSLGHNSARVDPIEQKIKKVIEETQVELQFYLTIFYMQNKDTP